MHPGTSICSSHRGFTLIELLVVIIIISIVVSITMLSIGIVGSDSQLTEEAQRLNGLVEAAQEQAEIQARDFGLTFHAGGYLFQRYDVRRGVWFPLEGDALFRARQLPNGVQPRLYVEGREIVLTEPQLPGDDEEEDAPPPPQIFIFANGDMTPFELTLERDGTDHQSRLTALVNGVLELKTVDDKQEDGA